MARTTAAPVLEVGDQLLALSLPQHPNQHGSERPILLAVDQQLGFDACGEAVLTPQLTGGSDQHGRGSSWGASIAAEKPLLADVPLRRQRGGDGGYYTGPKTEDGEPAWFLVPGIDINVIAEVPGGPLERSSRSNPL